MNSLTKSEDKTGNCGYDLMVEHYLACKRSEFDLREKGEERQNEEKHHLQQKSHLLTIKFRN